MQAWPPTASTSTSAASHYDGSTEPTLDTLAALVAAHNRSIPFENLDPLMGIPVIDLSADALADKLVRPPPGRLLLRTQRRRWHMCWRSWVSGCDVLGGRVVWMHDQRRAARADASGACGDGARRRRPLSRRRRVRRPDPVVADPARDRTRCSRPATSRTGSVSTATGYVLESEIRDSVGAAVPVQPRDRFR